MEWTLSLINHEHTHRRRYTGLYKMRYRCAVVQVLATSQKRWDIYISRVAALPETYLKQETFIGKEEDAMDYVEETCEALFEKNV